MRGCARGRRRSGERVSLPRFPPPCGVRVSRLLHRCHGRHAGPLSAAPPSSSRSWRSPSGDVPCTSLRCPLHGLRAPLHDLRNRTIDVGSGGPPKEIRKKSNINNGP